MANSSFEHQELSSYQRKYLEEVRTLSLDEPPHLWKFIQAILREQIHCVGWTKDNLILLVDFDGYIIIDPKENIEVIQTKTAIADSLSKDNQLFTVNELNEQVSVFGIYGGAGNHVCSDGWKLGLVYPYWPNAAVFMKPPTSGTNIWEEMVLIKLIGMEYNDLNCGFSPDESMFFISSTGGVNVFKR